MKMRIGILSIVVAMTVAFAGRPASAASPTKVTLAMDWYPNATHAGLYSAVYEGFFAEEGLEVDTIIPPPGSALVLLGTRGADFAIEGVSGLLSARSQGIPVVSVATIVNDYVGAMMVLEDSGIQSVQDFRGKTIGTSASAEFRARVETVLAASGVSLREVNVVDIGWGQTAALLSGSIDVAAGIIRTWQGVEVELEGYGVRFLNWSDFGMPETHTFVVATNESMIADESDTVRRFVRALVRGYAFAAEYPRRAADYVLKADPQLRADLVHRSVSLLARHIQGNAPAVGWHSMDVLSRFAAWMEENNLLAAPVVIEEAFTNRFLPENP